MKTKIIFIKLRFFTNKCHTVFVFLCRSDRRSQFTITEIADDHEKFNATRRKWVESVTFEVVVGGNLENVDESEKQKLAKERASLMARLPPEFYLILPRLLSSPHSFVPSTIHFLPFKVICSLKAPHFKSCQKFIEIFEHRRGKVTNKSNRALLRNYCISPHLI